jgi:acyl-CoA synthetase (AMP-forming)/AMP-acid ligase II
MTDWLSESAGLFDSDIFIIKSNQTYSFNEINDKANSLAGLLVNKFNISSGDLTAIISENNLEFILLVFALWKAGAVPVPINVKLNSTEIEKLLNFLSPEFIFIDPAIRTNILSNKVLSYQKMFLTNQYLTICPLLLT